LPHRNGIKGASGEDTAAMFLARAGYRIVSRNVRLPGGEIDLVAQDGRTIVFVEVKARHSRTFGSAFSAVDAKKRRTLRMIAEDYVQIVAPNAPFRFDVIAMDGDRLTHHRDAF